jgi:rod shape-determining protein MreC
MRVSAPVRAATQRLVIPGLLLLSIGFIVLGKADVLLVDRARIAVADALSPTISAISRPVATIANAAREFGHIASVYRENQALREENARLLQWQETARRLQAENVALRRLTRLVPENAVTFVAARVVAESGGAFARNVLVDAGSRDGVARGQAAATGEGLVGRVTEVGERTARVLLLTDLNSHVPVTIERTRERAVLEGDNSDRPRLAFLEPHADLQAGDRIVTSGSGGVFPPGLPVGVVAGIDGVPRVEPYAELSRLDLLRIIDYGLGGMLPQSVPPAAHRRPGRRASDEATR